MSYIDFKNRWNGGRIDYELFRFVNFDVLTSRKYREVTKPVVRFVSVLVMNYLSRFKVSPKMMLHYQPMLKNLIIMSLRMFRHVQKRVSINICGFASSPAIVIATRVKVFSTLLRTKLIASTFVALKLFFTVLAGIVSFPRFVVTLSSTKSSFLARRSLEFFTTKFTNMYHNLKYSTYSAWRIV